MGGRFFSHFSSKWPKNTRFGPLTPVFDAKRSAKSQIFFLKKIGGKIFFLIDLDELVRANVFLFFYFWRFFWDLFTLREGFKKKKKKLVEFSTKRLTPQDL